MSAYLNRIRLFRSWNMAQRWSKTKSSVLRWSSGLTIGKWTCSRASYKHCRRPRMPTKEECSSIVTKKSTGRQATRPSSQSTRSSRTSWPIVRTLSRSLTMRTPRSSTTSPGGQSMPSGTSRTWLLSALDSKKPTWCHLTKRSWVKKDSTISRSSWTKRCQQITQDRGALSYIKCNLECQDSHEILVSQIPSTNLSNPTVAEQGAPMPSHLSTLTHRRWRHQCRSRRLVGIKKMLNTWGRASRPTERVLLAAFLYLNNLQPLKTSCATISRQTSTCTTEIPHSAPARRRNLPLLKSYRTRCRTQSLSKAPQLLIQELRLPLKL